MAKAPTIRDLRHRIALCAAVDVVTADGEFRLDREDVLRTWAMIESKRASQFNRSGENLAQERSPQTHLITIRFRRDIDVTNTAWVYEERAQSGNRWWKVKGIRDLNEDSEWLVISAALIEKAVADEPDEPGATEQALAVVSHGVKL